MTASITSLQLSPEDSGKIISDVRASSAALDLTPHIDLAVQGSTFHTFGRVTVGVRSEGEARLAQNVPVVKREVATRIFYATVTETKELADANEALARKIFTDVPPQVSATLDQAVLGLRPDLDLGANFDTFADADEVEVTDRSTLIGAVGSTGSPTGILATSAFIWQLAALSDTTGHALFPDLGVDSTSLAGLKLRVVPSPEAVAVVGDFSWAVVGVNKQVSVQYYDQAILPTADGGQINLAAENKLGAVAEARYGYRIADLSKFKRMTVGTVSEG